MAKKGVSQTGSRRGARAQREKWLHMLLSREEWAMLLDLCDEHGLTASDMVRQLIRRAEAKFHKRK